MPAQAPRLIDLQIDWLSQYAPETKVLGDSPADMPSRLSQVDGYFSDTSAAFVSCGNLAHSLARIEAEFSGRLLFGREDLRRWQDDPAGLTWGVMALSDEVSLDRLPELFDRGVRVFSPAYPVKEFLARLLKMSRPGGPRPILDLARADRATSEILDWFEADEARRERILLLTRDFSLTPDNLTRFRALGVTVGVRICSPYWESTDEIRKAIDSIASLPFRGKPGYRGIAIATGFLETNHTLPGLVNAGEVAAWLGNTFEASISCLLIRENAVKLIEAMAGESV